jgi:chemotaxis protein methyltransferase CheR
LAQNRKFDIPMLEAYGQFCAYLQRVSGMVLSEEKKYLVESRILPIVRREKMSGLAQLVSAMESGRQPKLVQEVVESMTIHETYFFRDKTPFETFATGILPKLSAMRAGSAEPMRIWSAACSSGQEPYTISMLVEERQPILRGQRVEIVATDLSEAVLTKAREGVYSSFEVERGLAPERLKRHFTMHAGNWKVNQNIKERVSFRSLNLLADYGALGLFDFILCRNVLIYFNAAQKSDILRRLGKALRPSGVLMLGASESVMGSGVDWVADPDFKGCYRRGAEVLAIRDGQIAQRANAAAQPIKRDSTVVR